MARLTSSRRSAPRSGSTDVLRKCGSTTLPRALRERHGFMPGDAFSVIDLDGVLLLSPLAAVVPTLARELETLRTEEDLSTDEMLSSLQTDRARRAIERYGPDTIEAWDRAWRDEQG